MRLPTRKCGRKHRDLSQLPICKHFLRVWRAKPVVLNSEKLAETVAIIARYGARNVKTV